MEAWRRPPQTSASCAAASGGGRIPAMASRAAGSATAAARDARGWGWTGSEVKCDRCAATGWVPGDKVLYWCKDCARTVEAAAVGGACPKCGGSDIDRVTAETRPA